MGEFTAADKYHEAERELALRRRNYPRWIAAGRMSANAARRQILIMEAIAADYAIEAEATLPFAEVR